MIKSKHKSSLDLGHLLKIDSTSVWYPTVEHIFIHEVSYKSSDRTTIHQCHPSQEKYDQCMNLLEFIAIGEYLVYDLQLIVEEDLILNT